MRIAPTLVPTTEQSPFASARKENEPGASTHAPHPFIQTGIFHEDGFFLPEQPRQVSAAGRAIQWNGGEIVRFYASGERSSVLVFMPKDMSESSALVLPLFFKLNVSMGTFVTIVQATGEIPPLASHRRGSSHNTAGDDENGAVTTSHG